MGKGGLLAELKVSARGAEVCWDSHQGKKHWWTPSLQSVSALLALTLAGAIFAPHSNHLTMASKQRRNQGGNLKKN